MYPLLRFAKLLAVVMLFTGTVGALLPRDLADRQRSAYFLAGPGFGLTWIVGYLLAGLQSVSLLSTFVISALGLSLFSLQVVLFSVGRDGRRGPVTATLALAPLVATVALMVWRPR